MSLLRSCFGQPRLKKRLAAGAFVALVILPVPTIACSQGGCLNRGVELHQRFIVRVRHDGKPLPGVQVQVTTQNEEKSSTIFSKATDVDGSVHIAGLPPGDYWLNAELLGVTAGAQCFHVISHPSWKAKGIIKYEWGDLAPAARSAQGKFINSEQGRNGTPLEKLIHRVEVPIEGARLKLQNPLTGATYSAVSQLDGRFSFADVSNGVYVLHIDRGVGRDGEEYGPTDSLIRLASSAKANELLLTQRDASGGSCGGISLEVTKTP
jgi:hypothetical protein